MYIYVASRYGLLYSDGKDGMGHPGFEVDLAEKRPFFFVVKWDMA